MKFQEKYTLEETHDVKICYLSTIKRDDAIVKLRVIDNKLYPTKEYTGFVDFKEFIFYCVLFTSDELEKKNIRKLESILQRVLPININHNL